MVRAQVAATMHSPNYEYFHGDNGAGIGASHQTGWTGIVARLIQLSSQLQSKELLAGGKGEAFKQPQAVR